MLRRLRPTLAQTFFAANLCLAALLGALVYGLSRGSERTVLATSERARRATSLMIGQRIQAYLDQAESIIASVERKIQIGLCDPRDPKSVEAALFAMAVDRPGLDGISLTQGRALGFDENGRLMLAPEGRWQMAVYRSTPEPGSALHSAWVRMEGKGFVGDERRRKPAEGLLSASFVPTRTSMKDPTEHPTFITPASRVHFTGSRPVWSDLSYVEADEHLPDREKRVAVIAMRALKDREGRFAGVLRAGLLRETVDRILSEEQERALPNRIVLCDEQGRLLGRLGPNDPLLPQPDDSLRIVPQRVPEEIGRALRDEGLLRLGPAHLDESARFFVGTRPYLASFHALPDTQDWRVVVVAAEDELPGVAEERRMRSRLLIFVGLLSAVILTGGIFTLRTVRHGLGQITASSGRMKDFDFAPRTPRTFFRDMEEVMGSLELAKTAMRAMSKYVPVDLVRLLYRTGREPELGGEPMTVSLLFSDIKGFTTLAERLPPNELARVLGRYFEVMTAAIQGRGGTIDKYIGDAIMAVWNAPTPTPDHARRACEAALAAQAAEEALFASAEWQGRRPLVTRFGLHTDEVLVGHFGAPDRMSYTCLGDGVNLAARLEGLNKQYGTTLLVSDRVREGAGRGFVFRFLDVVTVSGKGQAVRVHELLGADGLAGPRVERAKQYEDAYSLYLRRDFARALAAFEALRDDDPPAAVLAERCRRLLQSPPGEGWDGVYVATIK
jgi:adenylate cyclase